MIVTRTTGNLGAIPAILITAVLTMAKSRMSDAAIAKQLGEEYEEMQRLDEAQITELALLLERETGTPSWKWFTILRNAREIGYYAVKNRNGDQPPPKADNTSMLMLAGLGALILVIVLKR